LDADGRGWTLLALAGLVPIFVMSGVRDLIAPQSLRNDTPGMSPTSHLYRWGFFILRKALRGVMGEGRGVVRAFTGMGVRQSFLI